MSRLGSLRGTRHKSGPPGLALLPWLLGAPFSLPLPAPASARPEHPGSPDGLGRPSARPAEVLALGLKRKMRVSIWPPLGNGLSPTPLSMTPKAWSPGYADTPCGLNPVLTCTCPWRRLPQVLLLWGHLHPLHPVSDVTSAPHPVSAVTSAPHPVSDVKSSYLLAHLLRQ